MFEAPTEWRPRSLPGRPPGVASTRGEGKLSSELFFVASAIALGVPIGLQASAEAAGRLRAAEAHKRIATAVEHLIAPLTMRNATNCPRQPSWTWTTPCHYQAEGVVDAG
jgi:hypothetical protein